LNGKEKFLMETKKSGNEDVIVLIETIYSDGWIPYPVCPGSHYPAVNLARWTDGLNVVRIRQYWRKHPNHLFRIKPG
jgi:hypothetical protein